MKLTIIAGARPNFMKIAPIIHAIQKHNQNSKLQIPNSIEYRLIHTGQHYDKNMSDTIGTGAVIGMGSIVTKDIEPYSIVAGNPAKLIRKRFNDNIINDLLNSHWWKFEDAELTKLSRYIKKPEEFINNLIK